jgi:hypothetical protein
MIDDNKKYLKSIWRKTKRFGIDLNLQILKISNLTYLKEKIFDMPDIKNNNLIYNPIVVCKLTLEQWKNNKKIGNLPFRDRDNYKLLEDNYIWAVSRGNQRILTALKCDIQYIDGYIFEDLEKTKMFGEKMLKFYNMLCKRYPNKYKYYG